MLSYLIILLFKILMLKVTYLHLNLNYLNYFYRVKTGLADITHIDLGIIKAPVLSDKYNS
jgi:hypothetical protein